jgi:membrane-associated HD superfamily phosphohydrolase
MNKYFKISTLLVLVLAAILLIISFDEVINPKPWVDNEDYLFPRFIASGIAILGVLLFFEQSEAEKSTNYKDLLPGLSLIIVYILTMKFIGFYLASMILFFAGVMIYRKPEESTNFWRVCIVRLSIAALFTLTLYGLFTEMLHVHPPRGMFF